MSDAIEEGDLVVTPEGEVKKDVNAVSDHYKSDWHSDKCIKLNDPIRVKVDAGWQAEALVSLAEEHGFELKMNDDCPKEKVHYGLYPFHWKHEEDQRKIYVTNKKCDYDLTFVDDLKQIEAWIEYHSESEDEWGEGCDECLDRGYRLIGTDKQSCPNCTDDDSYSEKEFQPPPYPTEEEMDETPKKWMKLRTR